MVIHLNDNTGPQLAQLGNTKTLIMGGYITKCHEGNVYVSLVDSMNATEGRVTTEKQ